MPIRKLSGDLVDNVQDLTSNIDDVLSQGRDNVKAKIKEIMDIVSDLEGLLGPELQTGHGDDIDTKILGILDGLYELEELV